MNRLIETRITSLKLLEYLIESDVHKDKAEKIVEDIFAISGSVFVGENGKFVTLRAKSFIGVASCNRYARHINRPAVPMRHGITLNAVKKDQRPDEFNFARGISIAASRLLTPCDEED